MGGLHALFVVEDGLADAQRVRRDLQQLVVSEEFEALLQAHLLGRDQTQRVVRAGGTHIGQLLLLADVDGDILLLGADAHDHALVHRHARADEQLTALLRVEEAVGDALAGLKGDEGAGVSARQIALVGRVGVEHARHNALALGVGKELVAVAEQAARRDEEFDLHAGADRRHLDHVALAGADLLDDRADALSGHVHDQTLDGLALLAVDGLVQHARGRDLELIALAAHGLDEDGQRHFAAARDVEGVHRALDLGHAQRNVLERFAEQALAQLAGGDELAVAARKGGIVDGEGHLHRRRGDLHKGQRLHALGRADGVADGDVADAGQADDVARSGLGNGLLAQTVELIEGDGLRLLRRGVGIVVVADHDLLILLERAALDASDGHAADELVVVDSGDEHLEGLVNVRLGRGNVVEDGIEERLEIGAGLIGRIARRTVSTGAEEHGAVKLLGRGVEVEQQLEHLVHDLVDALVGPVDLVDDHDHAVAQLQRTGKHEARLRHGTLGGVHEQDDAVDHLEDTLHLAAKVGVARRVDDVDLGIAIVDGGVLRKDGNAALTLKVVGVHYAIHDLLIFTVDAALLEHLVDERGLAVVDVRDNGDVA